MPGEAAGTSPEFAGFICNRAGIITSFSADMKPAE